jgi:quinoprotein dehydrogenase-associated probable ABC transporter substrate-binding protein
MNRAVEKTGKRACRARPWPAWYMLLITVMANLPVSTRVQGATDHEAHNIEYLTVCGDPNNLPFSNDQYQGFENRIAELIAAELGRTLHYRWWPQSVGFVRNTLKVRLCDLIMGISTVNDLVQNTNPYYRSVYALVYRDQSGLAVTSLTDPALRNLKIGVVAGTPPVSLLTRYDLLGQTHSYERAVDTRLYAPARDAIADIASGRLDLAVIWGPIAGYEARQQPVPLRVVPLPAEQDGVPLAFSVSLGIRDRETAWKHQLNALLEHLAPRIQAILMSYGVPLLDQQNHPITAPGS